MPAEQLRQLGGHADESESRRPSRRELDQNVDVAVRPEIFPQRRAEYGEFHDVVRAAELGQTAMVDGYVPVHHCTRFRPGLIPFGCGVNDGGYTRMTEIPSTLKGRFILIGPRCGSYLVSSGLRRPA